MKPRVLLICNALDDSTRLERGISTDSPAASRKVFMLCRALRLEGVRPLVVSLGRGRAGGPLSFFSATARRVGGVPVYYAPFCSVPGVSELISLLAPVVIVFRFRSQNPKAAVFYNRPPAYLAVLVAATALGYRNVIDLEDGEVPAKGGGLMARLVPKLYDHLCGGALLACKALSSMTIVRPVLCYYGTVAADSSSSRWRDDCVTVLMGGTLSVDTGADLLLQTLRQLRSNSPEWAGRLRIEVTGKGPSVGDFVTLAAEPGVPQIVVHGRTTDSQYLDVLRRSDVGLALKPIAGALANTTFPSKVIEFAAAGLLVLTTDISDVRDVLGAGAFYLTRDEPKELADLLQRVVEERAAARECASLGNRNVQQRCAPQLAGQMVARFIFRGMK